ncbi:MAG: stage 0 sporulation family protein [Clostridia bacterium]|nr:stage 0 sporulation family protein [Clostridia bacterium]
MIVVGVRFKKAGKIYYFDPENTEYSYGQNVIVETARGVEFGTVVVPNRDVNDKNIVPPLKPVTRKATAADIEKNKSNKQREKEAFDICVEKIKAHKLEMRLIATELTFDNNKIIFYFTADGRIDFRDLVKDLAAIFRTRIELRQIGVRDEAKYVNGIGICGRTLCCATFLGDFHPVSIKMAKDQGLSLNPSKISGVCGRLMCCLKYEQNAYEDLLKNLPKEGDIIDTPEGQGEVLSVNVLKQVIKTAIRKPPRNDIGISFFSPDEITILKRKHRREEQISKEDLKDLLD